MGVSNEESGREGGGKGAFQCRHVSKKKAGDVSRSVASVGSRGVQLQKGQTAAL